MSERDRQVTLLKAKISAAESALEILRGNLKSLQGEPCPYSFNHTKHWCGYETCRDS